MNNTLFDEFAESMSKLLPPGVDALKSDFERNARAALQTALTKMDLVTREDFDIQSRLLERTREKLDALEARLAALETPAAEKAGDEA